jgi:hypothetical protein
VFHHKPVSRRNPHLELLAVAHHIESWSADDRKQPDHMQHRWLPRQHAAPDLFVLGDMAFVHVPSGRIYTHGRLQRLHFVRLLVDDMD